MKLKKPAAVILALACATLLVLGFRNQLGSIGMTSCRLTELTGGGMIRLVTTGLLIAAAGICSIWNRRWALISGGMALGILCSVLFAAYQYLEEAVALLKMGGAQDENLQIRWGSGSIYMGVSLIFLLVLLWGLSYSQSEPRRTTRRTGHSASNELLNSEPTDGTN